MRNIFLAFALVLFTATASMAQCDKKIKWQGAKGELVDADGNVVDTKEATFVIIADAKTISIEITEEQNSKLESNVTETTCEWKEAFKSGKSIYKTTFVGPDGQTSASTITIEAKDGKLTAVVEMEKLDGRKVKIQLDKYETL